VQAFFAFLYFIKRQRFKAALNKTSGLKKKSKALFIRFALKIKLILLIIKIIRAA